ncbi:hypothetical protein SS50377_25280 [Spironucleus salmonicida]|uniref:Protein kinase domain-containing protein n=1 Tax=Spironucleus salmonicida TaxID=348837 RepID=V6LM96_9EUKA|nr:hypothetical protein SS50377_25280 [Spironucleus salmonicida]|eukprot:EST41839.1 Hypothetical protein SS50377_18673 [Spironucleus salmonicida]
MNLVKLFNYDETEEKLLYKAIDPLTQKQYIVKKIFLTNNNSGLFCSQTKLYETLMTNFDFYQNITIQQGVIEIQTEYIKEATKYPLSFEYFALQLLAILLRLQKHKIIHRNIIKDNLLIDESHKLHLIGFSQATIYDSQDELFSSFYTTQYDYNIDKHMTGQLLLSIFYPTISFQSLLFRKQEKLNLEIIRQLHYSSNVNIFDIIITINPFEFDHLTSHIIIFSDTEKQEILDYIEQQDSTSWFYKNSFSVEQSVQFDTKLTNQLVKTTIQIQKQNLPENYETWAKNCCNLYEAKRNAKFSSFLNYLIDN